MKIYADNAATTKISPAALKAMSDALENIYGNPSSLHSVGQEAAEALAEARKTVADLLNCAPSQVFFTSGGSESDNQAIISAARYGARKGKKHIVSTKIEHHAVLHTLEALEKEGFEVTYVGVGENGIVSPSNIENAIRVDTALVTVMYANNEIGTIQPIAEIGEICERHKVLFHTDAVQAGGHVRLDVNELKVDYLSLSAHKFNGPKGVGVLYAKRKSILSSIINGGAQESSKRAGTENVPSILSMAAALKDSLESVEERAVYVKRLRERLIDGLLEIPHTILNGDRNDRLAGNINVCFEGIEGESLILMLDIKGISASSGSACTSGSLDPSHVLLAIGRTHEIAHGSLRLTLDHNNTMEEVEEIINVTRDVVAKLREMSPVWDDLVNGRKEYVIQ